MGWDGLGWDEFQCLLKARELDDGRGSIGSTWLCCGVVVLLLLVVPALGVLGTWVGPLEVFKSEEPSFRADTLAGLPNTVLALAIEAEEEEEEEEEARVAVEELGGLRLSGSWGLSSFGLGLALGLGIVFALGNVGTSVSSRSSLSLNAIK